MPWTRSQVGGSTSPHKGVVVGTVSNNIDPLGRGRVRVRFPWFSDLAESAWARCSTPMAGSSRGMYFLPDIGDEVLVAFEHGNFNKPVVVAHSRSRVLHIKAISEAPLSSPLLGEQELPVPRALTLSPHEPL